MSVHATVVACVTRLFTLEPLSPMLTSFTLPPHTQGTRTAGKIGAEVRKSREFFFFHCERKNLSLVPLLPWWYFQRRISRQSRQSRLRFGSRRLVLLWGFRASCVSRARGGSLDGGIFSRRWYFPATVTPHCSPHCPSGAFKGNVEP